MKATNIIVPAMAAGFGAAWTVVLLLIQWYWWASASLVAAIACLWASHTMAETWVNYWFAFWRVGEKK